VVFFAFLLVLGLKVTSRNELNGGLRFWVPNQAYACVKAPFF